jgi:hypothetical protein
MTTWEELLSVCQVSQATRDDGLQCVAQCVEKGDRFVCLQLSVVWWEHHGQDSMNWYDDLDVHPNSEAIAGSFELGGFRPSTCEYLNVANPKLICCDDLD